MEVGIITTENLEFFHSLMLPGLGDVLEAGLPITALGLTKDEVAIGVLACHVNSSRVEIDSLYVAPDYRRQGGATLLLKTLINCLPEIVYGLEISFAETLEEHGTLHPFLKARGFLLEENNEENIYVTTIEEAANASFFRNSNTTSAISFAELDESTLIKANKLAEDAYAPLPEGGLNHYTVDRDVSVAYVENNEIIAYVALDHSCNDYLTVAAMWTGNAKPAIMALMLRDMMVRVKEKYPLNTIVAFQSISSQSSRLIKTLLPDIKTITYNYYNPLYPDNLQGGW